LLYGGKDSVHNISRLLTKDVKRAWKEVLTGLSQLETLMKKYEEVITRKGRRKRMQHAWTKRK
jgi:hypothetical protein